VALTEVGRSLAPTAEVVAQNALCATNLTNKEAEQLIGLCKKVKQALV